ncbi:Dimethylaniline monooxygenase [N-oxide-forming] 5 [Pseudocercospora fuligena]|uniref:Dimethylaniline monooxygenase [N-oxide-forming] 5 n=1 Tax=Pseudocercospora fuligena TaxID=685502 RepID=A0A8H6VC59_9PEZI|nr:Dimethylaniline monooxygenase [N-oxide-forming] 5 [Pseudocercospora fuligena]
MKKVCIVGAGPAGLAGAKVLLRTGKFDVKIFEKASRIGGIWALDENSTEGFLHPDTPTNLSKFTVGFSDLDWNSIDLRSTQQNGSANGEKSTSTAPMFPKAWQVNRYLEVYQHKYIPDEVIQLKHEVVATKRSAESSEATWHITIRDPQGQEVEHNFDYLMLGSGFFSIPRPMSQNVARIEPDLGVKAIHTSQFRTLRDLFDKPQDAVGKKVLLIGGGNSAGEAAAAVAQQLSDAWYSPKTGKQQDLYKDCKILHVTPRPLYALPPYNPVDDGCKSYVPIDLKLYDLKRRPEGPIMGSAGRVPKAVKDMIHGAIQGMVGGDQSDLGTAALTIPPEDPRSAVHVALSESYPEFVRSGLIEVQAGRVKGLDRDRGRKGATAEIERASGVTEVENEIGAVIYATGYSPASAIKFLPEDVKKALHYDPSSLRLPLILSGWQTTTSEVSDLAFLGFYEGPYWPMIEMQARYTAHRWLSQDSSAPVIRPYEEPSKLLDLRETMKARGNDVPQYWFGDYLGYMEEISSFLNLERNDAPFTSDREGCGSPARYLSSDSDKSQANAIMLDLHKTWTACTQEGRYTARAAFRALQGNWNISRTIDSKLPTFPSGILKGTASFHPRKPTSKTGDFDFEYLYIETGTLKLSNGAQMTARRRYVYRYSESRDELSVWFVKPDNDLEVDYLFHNLTFQNPASEEAKGLVAKADHLCIKDMYWTTYKFPMKGISLQNFETKHTVRGPEKDYIAKTEFLRPELKMY